MYYKRPKIKQGHRMSPRAFNVKKHMFDGAKSLLIKLTCIRGLSVCNPTTWAWCIQPWKTHEHQNESPKLNARRINITFKCNQIIKLGRNTKRCSTISRSANLKKGLESPLYDRCNQIECTRNSWPGKKHIMKWTSQRNKGKRESDESGGQSIRPVARQIKTPSLALHGRQAS